MEHDKPISAVSEDKLNREVFANQFAKNVIHLDCSECFTVGLYGPWGSGKSSILNMIKECLKNHANATNCVVIDFNPWNFTDCSQLISQFFTQLSNDDDLKTNTDTFKIYGKMLAKGFCSLAPIFPIIPIPGVGGVLESATSIIKNCIGEDEDLAKIKEQITEKLKKFDKKIIIIIDDIDRLPNEQIRLIFQMVASLAHFPSILYILSCDRDIVVQALANNGERSGLEYLEKIVQLPIEVPIVRKSKIMNILNEKFKTLVELPETENAQDWAILEFCVNPFINTIRDAKRLFNVVKFNYAGVKDEVNFIDFVGITSLQIFAPAIFEWIKQNKDLFVGKALQENTIVEDLMTQENTSDDAREKEKLAVCTTFYPKNPQLALNILASLFPSYSEKTNLQYIHSNLSADKLHTDRRIASETRFDIYFSLLLEDLKISTQEIEKTIFYYNDEQLKGFLAKIIKDNLTDYYFYECKNYKMDISQERLPIMIKFLTNLCPHLSFDKRKNRSLNSFSTVRSCNFTIRSLFKRIATYNERLELIKHLIKVANVDEFNIVLCDQIYLTYEDFQLYFADNTTDNQEQIEQDYHSLKKLYLQKLQCHASDKSFLHNFYSYLTVSSWLTFDKDSCENFLNKLLLNDKNAAKLPSVLVDRIEINEVGNYFFRMTENISLKSFAENNKACILTAIDSFKNTEEFKLCPLLLKEKIAAFKLLNECDNNNLKNEISLADINTLLEKWEQSYV